MHMYPGRIRPTLGAPPPAMARLGAVDPFRPPRAMFSTTSSPRISYPFATPPEQRDGYGAKYTDGGARPYVGMAMATQAQPYYAMFPPTTAGRCRRTLVGRAHAAPGASDACVTPVPNASSGRVAAPYVVLPCGAAGRGRGEIAARSGARTRLTTARPRLQRQVVRGGQRARTLYLAVRLRPGPAGRNGSLSGLSPTLQPPPASSSAASPTQRAPWP